MLAVDKQSDQFLYRQVIDLIGESIESGALKPGDRLPSLRKMSERVGVSVPTVRQAYVELERQRRVQSRPQSGFYVRNVAANPLVRGSAQARPAGWAPHNPPRRSDPQWPWSNASTAGLRRVVAGRLTENAWAMFDAAAFRITCTVI